MDHTIDLRDEGHGAVGGGCTSWQGCGAEVRALGTCGCGCAYLFVCLFVCVCVRVCVCVSEFVYVQVCRGVALLLSKWKTRVPACE